MASSHYPITVGIMLEQVYVCVERALVARESGEEQMGGGEKTTKKWRKRCKGNSGTECNNKMRMNERNRKMDYINEWERKKDKSLRESKRKKVKQRAGSKDSKSKRTQTSKKEK